MNKYLQMKKAHQEEVNNFPMVFAFSKQQFEEAMSKLGLTSTDIDKICSIGGGGIIRKTDVDSLKSMFDKHNKEKQEAINNDDEYIFQMFNYELSNHEYCYTGSISDTLDALGFTYDEIQANSRLLTALNSAIDEQRNNDK